MRIILIISVFLSVASCSGQKLLKFTTYSTDYSLNLPEGFEVKKLKDDKGYSEYQAVYAAGPIVYITDDNKSGGSISNPKIAKYGEDVYIKILANDTLKLEGEDSNGLFWKEEKYGKVVIGYLNVSADKKKQFDKALNTLRKQGNPH